MRKDYDGAKKYILELLKLNPESANAHHIYAEFLHIKRKEFDEAEKHYLKALELEPGSAIGHKLCNVPLKREGGQRWSKETHLEGSGA